MRIDLWKAGLALALGLVSQIASAGQSWELVSEKDGIKVYSMEIPGSDLIAFKGVKLMQLPITKVAQVILEENVERKKEWIDMIKDFRILERGSGQQTAYSAYDLPWPIEDRDYVIRSRLNIDNEANQIVLDLQSVEHPAAPQTLGVRAHLTHSSFKLVPKPGHATEVTVEIQTDPKGSLPKWLVNLIQKGWPSNTLKKLEKQAARPDTMENVLIKTQFKAANELASR
jgi:hypothetical protein